MSDDDKKKSTLDSIVMGAIIGTAIGSAIGMSVAPKKGSETREMIKEKTKDAGGLRGLAKKLFKKILGGKEEVVPEDMKEIPNEMETLPPSSSEANAKQ